MFFGFFLIACSILAIDVFLSYTNIMFKVIFLNDFTEPLNLIVGPLFYLYILAKNDESRTKRYYLHLIPSFVYAVYHLFYYLQPSGYKYNSYIHEYHRNMEFISVTTNLPEDPLGIKYWITELGMLSMSIYLILTVYAIYRGHSNSIAKSSYSDLIKLIIKNVGGILAVVIVLIFAKNYYPYGYGEYLIVIAITVMFYFLTFNIIKDSLFFHNKMFEQKYSKSGLDEKMGKEISSKIEIQMNTEKYFLSPTPTVSDLAKKIGTSPNYVSQVINQKFGLTFTELLAKHRIEEAKLMLSDPDNNATIEQIAYSVGYNSKSTFHTTFKRLTGKTPAEYKSSIQ